MIAAALGSFYLVAVSEIGDKTQLLAFSLAAKYKAPGPVLAGIFVATILNHALASTVGLWLSGLVTPKTLTLILGLLFLGFGLWTLKPDKLTDSESKSKGYGPFLSTALLFFLAEMGDKTQMATVALAAKYQSAVAVTIGTTLGMMVTDGVAVFAGQKLAHKVQMRWIRICAATLFFVFGIGLLFDYFE